MSPRCPGASQTASRSARPVLGSLPCTVTVTVTITGAPAWAAGCQAHRSGQQPGEPEASGDLPRAFEKEGRGFCGRGPPVWLVKDAGRSVSGAWCVTGHLRPGHSALRGRVAVRASVRLARPRSSVKCGSVRCRLFPAPAPPRPRPARTAAVAGGARVFIRVQSQFSHTLDKLFVESLYS